MTRLNHVLPTTQLQPVDLVAPGFRGLNFVQSGALLSPAFATEAMNCVLDSNGRLAARDGVTNLSTTPISGAPVVRTIFEYVDTDGNLTPIVAWDGGIGTSVSDPAGNDISGSVTDASGDWRFVNFNDKLLGFQSGQRAIAYTGTGSFAPITVNSGTAPTGGIGMAAWGRVWQLGSDKQTIYYSALLDETRWAEADGAGLIDMRKVWTDGTDTVTGIAAFNGALIVFGTRHIVFWTDGKGSALGIDPDNLYVVDTIAGTGCLSQHTMQPVGETDLLFLSSNGVQSIKRLISERSAPISTLSKYVRDEMLFQLQSEDVTKLRSTYNPLYGFYLLSFPQSAQTWVFDQRRRWRDEDGDELSIVTRWDIAPTALFTRRNNSLLVARTGGKVGQYLGDNDEGTAFRFIYQSPWLDLGEDFANRLKILKRLGAILFVRNETAVIFKWNVDFDDGFQFLTRTVSGDAAAEWGTGEWGAAEWSGGLALRILKVPARGRGQYYRIGVEADVNGEFSLQQAELFTKIGRLA